MPKIFHVTANENARYKCNELEFKETLQVQDRMISTLE